MKTKEKPINIDDYLISIPEEAREKLEKLRMTIQKAVPDAEEVISYSMPAFRYHGMLAFFAAFKNHYGLYVMRHVVKAFEEELKPYKTAMATVQFQYDKPLPVQLVTKMVKYGAKTNLEKAQLKLMMKSKKK